MLGLVIVDMQRWMFRYPQRTEQLPMLNANIAALAKAFGDACLPIFQVDTVHKADRSTWSRLMQKYNYPCLIEGTIDIAPVDGFNPPPEATRITKTTNSAFIGTKFESRLKEAGVSELALAGVFVDGCVGLTAADAAQRGFEVTFVTDAIGHARAERRQIILDWLKDDYELKIQSTEQLVAQLGLAMEGTERKAGS